MLKGNDYGISLKTMGLEAMYHPEFNTRIYDVEGIFYTTQTIKQLLEEACEKRFADYNGRINAVRKAFPYYQKTPLIICLNEMLYAIPTISPKDYNCKWIFPDHIKDYIKKSGRQYVVFKNGLRMMINCSEKTILHQQERARNCLVHFYVMKRELSNSSRNRNY